MNANSTNETRNGAAGGNGDRLLTSAEAATYLGLDDHAAPSEAIRYLCRTRRLKHVKVGRGLRFRLQWLDNFIDTNSIEPITSRARR